MSGGISMKDIRDKVDGREMDLSLMQISKVPVKEISSIPKATSLDLSCNLITRLPEKFPASLSYLVKLDLSKNKLEELPKDFYKLSSLQRLDLYQNNLQELPITFSRMKTLKWLDLKDNPLEPVVAKVVGGCLDDEECKKCAIAVVMHYKNVSSDMERIKQQELKKEREKQELIRRAEEEEERKRDQERKKKKQLEKEERRKKWEETQKERQLENKKRKRVDDSSDGEIETPNGGIVKHQKSSWLTSFWGVLVLCFIAVVLSAIGIRLYCDQNSSNQECVIVREWTETYKEATNKHFNAILKNCNEIVNIVVKRVQELWNNLVAK